MLFFFCGKRKLMGGQKPPFSLCLKNGFGLKKHDIMKKNEETTEISTKEKSMTNYKIIASDLDGTLLNGRLQVSEENWNAIRRMSEMGILVVPSSGRTLYEIPKEILESPLMRYIIHSDGAAIYDKETGESIRFALSREKSAKLMEIVSEYDVDVSVRNGGHSYTDAKKHTEEYHYAHRMDKTWVDFSFEFHETVEEFEEFCRTIDGIDMACVFFRDSAEQEECCGRVAKMNGVAICSSDPANLEFHDIRAGKGNALLCLAERLGIDPADTVAVGDSPNDLDMIQKAALGLAVENACEELRSATDEIVCSNEEHVMDYILNKYFL